MSVNQESRYVMASIYCHKIFDIMQSIVSSDNLCIRMAHYLIEGCSLRALLQFRQSGPGCSKLTMSLVNVSLKF